MIRPTTLSPPLQVGDRLWTERADGTLFPVQVQHVGTSYATLSDGQRIFVQVDRAFGHRYQKRAGHALRDAHLVALRQRQHVSVLLHGIRNELERPDIDVNAVLAAALAFGIPDAELLRPPPTEEEILTGSLRAAGLLPPYEDDTP